MYVYYVCIYMYICMQNLNEIRATTISIIFMRELEFLFVYILNNYISSIFIRINRDTISLIEIEIEQIL